MKRKIILALQIFVLLVLASKVFVAFQEEPTPYDFIRAIAEYLAQGLKEDLPPKSSEPR